MPKKPAAKPKPKTAEPAKPDIRAAVDLDLLDRAIKDPDGLTGMDRLRARVAWASLKKHLGA